MLLSYRDRGNVKVESEWLTCCGRQGSVEKLKQAVGFLEDAQEVGELLDADFDEMEEMQQVCCPSTVTVSLEHRMLTQSMQQRKHAALTALLVTGCKDLWRV